MKEILRHPDCAKGTWWWMEGNAGPVVSCPECQALHQINLVKSEDGEPWFVDPDGTVHPSLFCTACSWHADVRLKGWTGSPP